VILRIINRGLTPALYEALREELDIDRSPALEALGAPLEAEITVFELQHLVTP